MASPTPLSTSRPAILRGLIQSGRMLEMFTDGLTREQLHHRATARANCAAWILGHLVLYERRALSLLGTAPADLPALPFGDFETRFASDDTAAAQSDYGHAEVLPGVFAVHRRALIAAVEQINPAKLDEPLPQETRIASTVGELLLFFPMHVAMHVGQISTIRRSLGMPPLV